MQEDWNTGFVMLSANKAPFEADEVLRFTQDDKGKEVDWNMLYVCSYTILEH
jgi:hypothetical protein